MNLPAQFSPRLMAFYGLETPGDFASSSLLWLLLYLLPLAAAAFVIYKAFSGPLRRKEQTRLILDLMEAGFRQGQRPEAALAQVAQTTDPSLGDRFQRLAAKLGDGARLSQALEAVPNLLPPQVAATIRVGEEVGDVRKVLPACRSLLRDAESETRSGFNYLVIASLVIMPIMPILILILNIYVFPELINLALHPLVAEEPGLRFDDDGLISRYLELRPRGGSGYPEAAVTLLVMRSGFWVAGAQLLVAFCLWCWVWFYMRGPRACGGMRVNEKQAPHTPLWKIAGHGFRLRIEFGSIIRRPLSNFIGRPLTRLRDRILYALPWRRRRLQRDFCATLSILLDAETPEPAAVALAAEATANYVFIQRARRALQDLKAGEKLQLALRRFDKAGEFSWRLANAADQQGGFLPALEGWIEALDAKAFQQEQTASQLITTGLVLCNGLVVGLIATRIFAVLISLEQ